MKLTYPGPHAHVLVAAIPAQVERGGTLEVDGDLAAQLIEQGWLAATDRPDGNSVAAILTWVDGDAVRAASQLEAETSKGDKARASLVEQLTEIINPASADTSEED